MKQEKQEKKPEPSKRIRVNGIEMTKNQAYLLWQRGLLAGPVKQQVTGSAWQSTK